jgi:hypothetical protein
MLENLQKLTCGYPHEYWTSSGQFQSLEYSSFKIFTLETPWLESTFHFNGCTNQQAEGAKR